MGVSILSRSAVPPCPQSALWWARRDSAAA
jgi:hypothetical protein